MKALALFGVAVVLGACSSAQPPRVSEVTTTSARIEEPGTSSTLVVEPRASQQAPAEALPAPPVLPTRVEPPGAALGNSRVVAIVAAANEREMRQARLAVARAQDQQVKDLAQLVYDHRHAATAQQQMLAASEGISAMPGRVSARITEEGDAALASLSGQSLRVDFDKSYVALLAREQESLLDVIDYELMPAASDVELRKFLIALRPIVADDLARARAMQQILSKQ